MDKNGGLEINTENECKKQKRTEWQETLAIIWEILKTGPKYPHEIYNTVKQKLGKKGRPKTAERVLKSLSELGITEKRNDGRYYFVSDTERVKSPEEYKIRLYHSQALLGLYQNTKDIHSLLDNKFFMEHIETGYPDIKKLIKDWKSCQNELTNLRSKFEAILIKESEKTGVSVRILKTILEITLKIENPTIEKISEILSFENLFDLIVCEVKFGSKTVNLKNLTPNYVLKLLNEIKEIYQNINSVEEECEQLQSELRDYLDVVALQVYHGTPLKGYCQMCPKIKVEAE